MMEIEKKQKLANEKAKLEHQRNDALVYIESIIETKQNELISSGYLTPELKTTLSGKAVCCCNEVDGYIVVEYFQNLFASFTQKYYSIYDLKYILPFIIGSLIDDRDLNKEDDPIEDIVDVIFQDYTKIANVKYELNYLKELHETFQTETKLTTSFGSILYLWSIEQMEYNEIQQFIPVSYYEGNFIKNILKVHSMCEEMLKICDIFATSPEIVEVLKGIQSSLFGSNVICDSIYIKS